MNEKEAIKIAEDFLSSKGIEFVRPGAVKEGIEEYIEVIFYVPEYYDPNVAVVDPPDVRVKVNLNSGLASLVPQM